jgi:hypothetical protein
MKKIVNNLITFLIAIVGLVGGIIWIYISKWDMEPIILSVVSLLEIGGFIILRLIDEPNSETENKYQQNINNAKKVNKQINIQKNKGKIKM